MDRKEYSVRITVNEIAINKVIIDPHYRYKHGDYMTDELLTYFGYYYKLIWLLEDHHTYIGVINAYRR